MPGHATGAQDQSYRKIATGIAESFIYKASPCNIKTSTIVIGTMSSETASRILGHAKFWHAKWKGFNDASCATTRVVRGRRLVPE